MASNQYNPRRQQPAATQKKKRSGASKSTHPQIPGWAWLVVGIAVGLFVSFLVKLVATPAANTALKNDEKISKSATLETANSANKTALGKGAEKTADKNAEKTPIEEAKPATRFDFYTLLPEREVIVPNEREAIKPSDKQKVVAGQPPVTDADESLFLQVGSFRSAQEAERRRAQIIQLGLEAKVESVQANGDTWYRVQSGPFTSRDKLSKARTQLSSAGIESLLLKQKPQG